MPVYKYFGQPAKYHGKPLFHILANLKNFGKGRIVTRSQFDSDPQQPISPSFYRILWAQPLMDSETLEGRVVAEKVRKGVRYTEPVDLADLSAVPDFRLISKNDEVNYCKWETLRDYSPDIDYVVEPKFFEVPPLLKLLMERNMAERQEMPGEESFLLPHFKTVIAKNTETVDMGDRQRSRVEQHQETITRCEGTASYNYGNCIHPIYGIENVEVVQLIPDEPPMPSPAVGMRLYKWPNTNLSHKEEIRTDEHSSYFP